MSPAAAWTVLIVGFVLPLIHVALSKDIGPAKESADGGTCPFSPRIGWIVIVLFLGPIGWLMFMGSRRKKRALAAGRAGQTAEVAKKDAP
ncbi:MAG: hypothetical protein HUJ16_01145 [Kangiella sp.]|nr:hypothetical protein [Kangiella sp.]